MPAQALATHPGRKGAGPGSGYPPGEKGCRPRLSLPTPTPPPRLLPLQVLAVHLLHEVSKGGRSFWCPYLKALPRSYTTAMCFRPAEVEALQVWWRRPMPAAAPLPPRP